MEIMVELKHNLKKIELIEIEMPYVHPFRTSFGEEKHKQAILVRIEDENENVGWGETSVTKDPGYAYETVKTAWHIQQDFLIPIVKKSETLSIPEIMKNIQKVRGHEFAKSGIESALLALKAEQDNVSLGKIYGSTKDKIPTGVSVGIQKSVDYLVQRVQEFHNQGYRKIKIKIEPGWDIEPVKAIRKELGDIPLMVDANSAYTLDAVDMFKKMDEFELMMIEQPLAYNDVLEHKKLQDQIETPVCLDESIHNPRDARLAIEFGCAKIINIKPARVGGYLNAIQIAEEVGKDKVWCGGMLETGIGRLHNVFFQARDEFTIPGDTSGSDRYFKPDIIDPKVEVSDNGYIKVPKTKGLGSDIAIDLLSDYTIKSMGYNLYK